MKKPFAIFFFAIISLYAKAGDSIQVQLNQASFGAKDSIIFSYRIPNYREVRMAAVTLNLWIQNIETGRTWKYRYPVLNGECEGALVIGDSIPPGRYALNFILQNNFFRVNGKVRDTRLKTLNYLMVGKNKESYLNTIDLGPSGTFTIKNMLFEEKAMFVFSPAKKVRQNDLFIDVVAPLDSAFTPASVITQVIDVKPEQMPPAVKPAERYKFDFSKTWQNTTLPDVVVIAKAKNRMKQYDEEYSTGLFQDINSRVFNGLDNDEIANTPDLMIFLQGKIPGLKVDMSENIISWRGQSVTVYIDEFRLQPGDPIYINPTEVAMIKVFPPPAFMNVGGSGGAIAIYTKKGAYEDNSKRRYSFSFKGYTPQVSTWK